MYVPTLFYNFYYTCKPQESGIARFCLAGAYDFADCGNSATRRNDTLSSSS
jgi:hypothetical protein